MAVGTHLALAALNFLGVRKVTNVAVVMAVGAGILAFLMVVVPVWSGDVDWAVASS